MNENKAFSGKRSRGTSAYAVLTSPGGREVNEDSAQVKLLPGRLGAALADGLGGHGGGELASRTAVEEFLLCFENGAGRTREELAGMACRANEAVAAKQTEDCRMMATLAGLVIEGDQASWVHAGDSRLYHFHDQKLISHTLDHSVPQMAVMMGMIREEQIRFHEDRGRILRALGSDSFEPEVSETISLKEGMHAFLLCSDGFWEYVLEREMEETLAVSADPQGWLRRMEQILRKKAPSNMDNYTAAAVWTAGGMCGWKNTFA